MNFLGNIFNNFHDSDDYVFKLFFLLSHILHSFNNCPKLMPWDRRLNRWFLQFIPLIIKQYFIKLSIHQFLYLKPIYSGFKTRLFWCWSLRKPWIKIIYWLLFWQRNVLNLLKQMIWRLNILLIELDIKFLNLNILILFLIFILSISKTIY